MRTKYSVLALDGGGIRGVIPARVLQALEERLGRPVCELFDLVAGTSTGGILALGLTTPGVAKAVEYQMTRLCRHADGSTPRYHRLESSLPTASPSLDDACRRNLDRLLADADTLLSEDAAGPRKLDAICAALEEVAIERDAERLVVR